MFQFSPFLTVTSQKQQEAVFSFLMEHKKKSIHLFMRKILPSRAAGDQRKLKESEY